MKLLSVFVFILFSIVGFSQQDPQFSFNMFNQLTYNPGFAGNNDAICVSSIHRQQWVGFGEGRPQTTVLNAHAALKPFGIKSGVGLSVVQEKIGFQKNLNMAASYAYRQPLSSGNLGIGLSLGFQNTSFNGDWVTPDGGPSSSDQYIPLMSSQASFDLGFGAFYKGDNGMYVGISSTHLTSPKIKLSTGGTPFIARHYYLVGSYTIQLGNPIYELQPIIFAKSDGVTVQFTPNVTFIYNRRFWGGVSYNIQDAVSIMVGMNLNMGLSFGYSYDLGLSKIGSYNSGSHELYVRYCFNLNVNKIPGRYKSVRFL